MYSKLFTCSCPEVAESDAIVESTTNFDIVPFKTVNKRLPQYTYKYVEDIKQTLLESCNFKRIQEVLDYLEMEPATRHIVPELLEFISCELKEEDQQRAPILLKALHCLRTNSVSAVNDFSVCTKALEHFLTKSSTFPGDYVLKDIAADILSDFCAMSHSDDLKEHFILQLSRVFHNPNWHSYNLYGGIVGCLSNMSVESGPEVVPYDEFNSDTFLRHVLSSPKMLKKLFYLCKPFIYRSLPSRLIPRPLHNENSFYDVNTRYAGVFNLMRNEMVTPISYVKYDHKFSFHYMWPGGWVDDLEWNYLPADSDEDDFIVPGFSEFQREKMLKKNSEGSEMDAKSESSINGDENGRNSQIYSESEGSINSSDADYGLQNSQPGCKSDSYLYFTRRESSLCSGHKSDGYVDKFKKKYPDFDRSDYTKMWLDRYGGNSKRNESEMSPLNDRKEYGGYSRPGPVKKSKKRKYSDLSEIDPLIGRSTGLVGNSCDTEISGGLRKQNRQESFSGDDTDGSKSEENLQVENNNKLGPINLRQHQASPKTIEAKGLRKQDVQSDLFKDNTEDSNSDENFQIKNEWKIHNINLKRLQISLKKIDWKFDVNMDTTDHGIDPQIDSKDEGGISSREEEKKIPIAGESDSNVKTCESERISQIGGKCGDENNSFGDVKNSEGESNLPIDSKSDGATDITDCERNLRIERKSCGDVENSESRTNLQQSDGKSVGNADVTDHKNNLQDDNTSNEEVKKTEREMNLPFYIIYDSTVDGMIGITEREKIQARGWHSQDPKKLVEPNEEKMRNADSQKAKMRDDCEDMDISNSKENSQYDLNDWKRPIHGGSETSEHIKFSLDEDRMRIVDSQKIQKPNGTKSQESRGFRNHEEYQEFLAWKKERTYSDSHGWNEIGETLKLIPPPAYINESLFEHRIEDLIPDTHIISSEYISEESLLAVEQHCCERAYTSSANSPQPDIFKNLDKNIFANWEFKKPKGAKKESPVSEKSETRGPFQKKWRTRGGRKR